jgi:hypothetical protein
MVQVRRKGLIDSSFDVGLSWVWGDVRATRCWHVVVDGGRRHLSGHRGCWWPVAAVVVPVKPSGHGVSPESARQLGYTTRLFTVAALLQMLLWLLMDAW